jgi:hypothetical protein
MGCVVKKLHEPVAGLIACVFLEKLCRSFHYSNLFPTAEAIHWFRETPSSRAKPCAAFLIGRGSFEGSVSLLIVSPSLSTQEAKD